MAALTVLIDFILPDDVVRFSWGTAATTAFLVLDVSTEMGEYFRLVDQFHCNSVERRRLVTATTLSTVGWCVLTFFLGGVVIGLLTRHMDDRMYSILEGLSRLLAAVVWMLMSIETPKWVGFFHSPTATSYLAGRALVAAENDTALVTLIKWNFIHKFLATYILILPFISNVGSILMGIFLGFVIDLFLFLTRRVEGQWKVGLCCFLAVYLAISSAVFFASACRFIQTVWNIKAIQSETALVRVAFLIWLSMIAFTQYVFYKDTQKEFEANQRISTAALGENTAMSLLISSFEEKMKLKEQVLNNIGEEEDEEPDSTREEASQRLSVEQEEVVGKTKVEVWYRWIQRTLYAICALLSLLLVVSNIGATFQMAQVRARLPLVDTLLYHGMNEMPVCGLDVNTQQVQTFPHPDAAHAAGYGVAHCGPCAACSTWHNLRLQYTTKAYLADESAMCARRSLYGGREASLECLRNDPLIGFQGQCAECWVDDILCSKQHCMFIFLQSAFINKISNFEVSTDDVTSATCEEAMCEMVFVPCSGANRRRMNIHSDIERPPDMLCTNVDFDWEELFGENGTHRTDAPVPDIELLGAARQVKEEGIPALHRQKKKLH